MLYQLRHDDFPVSAATPSLIAGQQVNINVNDRQELDSDDVCVSTYQGVVQWKNYPRLIARIMLKI
jgi:hypothetical protein